MARDVSWFPRVRPGPSAGMGEAAVNGVRCALLLCLPAVAAALPPDTLWTRTFGGALDDVGYSVIETDSGELLVTGLTASYGSGGLDMLLVWFDREGNVTGHITCGGAADDAGHFATQVPQGGYLVAGYTASFGSGGKDVWLVRFDEHGETLWTRTYGGELEDCSYYVEPVGDSGFLVAGYRDGPQGWDKGDLWVLRLDANGDTTWTSRLGGLGEEMAKTACRHPEGGCLAVGYTTSYGAGASDALLVALDSRGDTLWTRSCGTARFDVVYDADRTTDGSWLVAGCVDGPSTWVAGDLWLVKVDDAGDTLWTRRYGGPQGDGAFYMQPSPGGGFLVAGSTASFGNGRDDVWLLRVDDAGDTAWTATFGGWGREFGHCCCPVSDGGYAVTGMTETFGSGGPDVWLVRTGPDTAGAIAAARQPGFDDAPTATVTARGPDWADTWTGWLVLDAAGRTAAPAGPGIYFLVAPGRPPRKVLVVR